jgi:hypothetical protein
VDDLRAHRTEHEPFRTVASARADHDQIGIQLLGCIDDDIRRLALALDCVGVDPLRLQVRTGCFENLPRRFQLILV